ncbi:MAG: hypothetical protein ACLP0J_08945 [Solirubrobacteraceae bacterium]
MTGLWRARSAAAVAALLVYVGPAMAAGRSSALPNSLSVAAKGSLMIRWHGDPARGCAAAGLCGTYGETLLASNDAFSVGSSGPVTSFSVDLAGTVRVRRGEPGAAGVCVEVPNSALGPSLEFQRVRGGRWTVALQPAPSSGTCAGPLPSDLAHVLLPITQRGNRYPRFVLNGTRAFAAGPFSAELISAVVVSTAPTTVQLGGGGSVVPVTAPRRHRVVSEYVKLSYRVAARPSALQVGFTGTSDPICQAFDSCGTSGSISVALANVAPTFTLSASRAVKKARGSAHAALRDFRNGRLRLDYLSSESLTAAGVVTETLTRTDGSGCTDSTRVPGLMFYAAASSGSTRPLVISLENGNYPGADVLRTHCEGPDDSEITGTGGAAANFGAPVVLAQGSLSPSQLLNDHADLTLSNPGMFHGIDYSGTRAGALTLQLTLVGEKAGFREKTES